MKNYSFLKISQDAYTEVLDFGVGQQVTSVLLLPLPKPNGLIQSRLGFHKGRKEVLSIFGAIENFGIFAIFSKFQFTQLKQTEGSKAESLQIFSQASHQTIAKSSGPSRTVPRQTNF